MRREHPKEKSIAGATRTFRAGLVLTLTLAFATGFTEEAFGQSRGLVPEVAKSCPGPRISAPVRPKAVGAWPAAVADWPGLAVIRAHNPERSESVYFCGGSVISPNWVLTAAHCVYGEFKKDSSERYSLDFETSRYAETGFFGTGYLQVVLGDNALATIEAGHVRDVSEVIVHSGYDKPVIHQTLQRPDVTGHDIALLRLSKPWTGEYVRLALQTNADPRTPPGATAMVAGFGQLAYEIPAERFDGADGAVYVAGSAVLREVDVPTVSTPACKSQHQSYVVGDGQICAGFENEEKDSCKGDSGGQLVSFDRNGCPYQIGIVSWGKKCAEPKNYSVYTRVSHFASWILDHVPETLLTIAAADVPDWESPARRLEVAGDSLDELEKLMGTAKGGAAVALRRTVDGTLVPHSQVTLGERYSIEVTSQVPGRLILIDIDAVGTVTQIFPNKFVQSEAAGSVRPGVPMVLPGDNYGFTWFRASEPTGLGRLIALVVPEDFPVGDWIGSEGQTAKGLVPEKQPTNYLMNLTTQVYNALNAQGLDVAPANRWALRVEKVDIRR